jgi:hypothetical protein
MSQALQLSFQTNTDQARNAIAQLASTVASNMVQIGTAMKMANDNQDKLKAGLSELPSIAGRAAAGLLAVGAAIFVFHEIGKSIEDAKEKLKEMVDIGQNARGAGVGTDFFQAWTSHAKELNTTAEQLAGTLDRARAASDIHLGTGGEASTSAIQDRLGQHVAAGNIGQGDLDSFNTLKSQEDRIRAILDLIERLNREGRGLAALDIAGHFFGADFEQKLRQGTAGVRTMREDLDGITKTKWPPDMVKTAEDINAQLDRASRIMSEAWLPVQQDISRVGLSLLGSYADMRDTLARIATTASNIYGWFRDLGTKLGELANSDFFKMLDKYDPRQVAARLGRQVHEAVFGEQYGPGMEDLPEGLRRDLTVTGRPDKSKPLPGPSAKEATEAKTALESYLDTLQKSVATLNAEADTYGKSNIEKAKAVDLAKAEDAARRDSEDGKRTSADLTDEERKQVERFAEAEGKAKDRTEQLTRSQTAANEQAQLLGNSLISALDKIGEKGAKATDVLKDMLKTLVKAVEQALLLGSGPFANLFGTQGAGGNTGGLAGLLIGGAGKLFGGGGGKYGAADYEAAAAAAAPGAYGPGFASGGLVGRDGTPTFIPYAALATAKRFDSGGGVAAILHQGEVVLNAAQQRNVAGSIGGNRSINITHAPVINGTGLSKEELFSVLQRDQKELHRNIGALMQDWQRRYA